MQTSVIKKTLLLALLLLGLAGCQQKSEIDKCVEAIVKINPTNSAQEGQARLSCLKAASGVKQE